MICLKATLPIHQIRYSIVPSKQFHHFHVRNNRKSLSVKNQNFKLKFSVFPQKSSKMDGATSTSVILTSGASGRVNALLSLKVLKSLVMLINAFLLLLLFPFQRRRSISSSTLNSTEKSKDEKQEISSQRKSPVVRVPAVMVSRRINNSALTVEQDVITRRAIAIKRVNESGDEDDDDEETIREISLFVTSRGDTLFTQSWTPVSIKINAGVSIKIMVLGNGNSIINYQEKKGPQVHHLDFVRPRPVGCTCTTKYGVHCMVEYPRAVYWVRKPGPGGLVVLLHGLNEHSGRYNKFAKQLNSNGYKVYAMDWIGHGGSDGLHAYVHSLDYAVTDMKAFVEKVLVENPGFPCFCFGHSTGAAIVLKAVLDPVMETLVQGVVVTSPAVGVQASHPIVWMLAPVFSFLIPKYQFSGANKKGMPVSRDPAALVAKYSDPLVYTGSVRMRTGSEILRISSFLQKNLTRFTIPFLVLHGTADTVTDPEASEKLYEEASSTDKSIKLYEGYLHDLLFEPEREDITKEIIDWLNSRTEG